jgi:1,4-dihydroxy-2-naphthoyl-CoA hydrolase
VATIWWNDETPDILPLGVISEGSMSAYLGMEFTGIGPDWLKVRMPVDSRTRQPYGRLHGGASVALAETVGSMAAGMTVDRTTHAVVGMEINANHIRPAYDGFVYATARPENLGRTTQVWSIRIEDDAGKLVCISRLTMAVISLDRK